MDLFKGGVLPLHDDSHQVNHRLAPRDGLGQPLRLHHISSHELYFTWKGSSGLLKISHQTANPVALLREFHHQASSHKACTPCDKYIHDIPLQCSRVFPSIRVYSTAPPHTR